VADDIKIQVSAPGATQTEQDLRKVAGAEQAVGRAAKGATPAVSDTARAKAGAAQSTRELDDKNRTLAERLRALGPEFALLGDAVDSVTLKEGKSAAVVGVLGVAMLGLTMAIQKYVQWSAERKQQAQALHAELAQQAEDYLNIAQAVEKAQAAEDRRGRPAAGGAPAAVVQRLAKVRPGAALGKDRFAATAAALALTEGMTDEQVGYLKAFSATEGRDVQEGSALLAQFEAFMQSPGAAARLDEQIAKQRQRLPLATLARQTEDVLAARGTTPQSQSDAALKQLAQLVTSVTTPGFLGIPEEITNESERVEALRKLFLAGPQLEYQGADPEVNYMLGAYQKIRRQYPEHSQVILQGTNYINMDKTDPAGVPIPTGME